MVQPLKFSMIMTLDAKGVGQGAKDARQEITATGQAAKAAGGDLGTADWCSYRGAGQHPGELS